MNKRFCGFIKPQIKEKLTRKLHSVNGTKMLWLFHKIINRQRIGIAKLRNKITLIHKCGLAIYIIQDKASKKILNKALYGIAKQQNRAMLWLNGVLAIFTD